MGLSLWKLKIWSAVYKMEDEGRNFKDLSKEEKGCVKAVSSEWFNSQTELRKLFNMSLAKKCKVCKSCCCNGCSSEKGYFGDNLVFNKMMFNSIGLDIPKVKSGKDSFYDKDKGCTLPGNRRSVICVFYDCGYDKIINYYKRMWYMIIQEIGALYELEEDKKNMINEKISDIHRNLRDIRDYNYVLKRYGDLIKEKQDDNISIDYPKGRKKLKKFKIKLREVIDSNGIIPEKILCLDVNNRNILQIKESGIIEVPNITTRLLLK